MTQVIDKAVALLPDLERRLQICVNVDGSKLVRIDVIETTIAALKELRDGTPQNCTCHPDDNPPKPCPKKFALSACRAAQEDMVERVARAIYEARWGMVRENWPEHWDDPEWDKQDRDMAFKEAHAALAALKEIKGGVMVPRAILERLERFTDGFEVAEEGHKLNRLIQAALAAIPEEG